MKLVLLLVVCVSAAFAEKLNLVKHENPEYGHAGESKFREGDMMVGGDDGDDRNMVSDKRRRWPMKNGFVYVPYVFDGSQTPGAKDQVAAAIKDYARWTCVKFVPRSSESDYLAIFNSGDGCYSSLGKTGGKQKLSLSKGCAFNKGTPTHEMMHALGFDHEQSREDRDNYVRLITSNFKPGNDIKAQFAMCPSPKCTMPRSGYDYDSVMHYEPDAFSRNGQDTIQATRGGVKFGQRAGLSEGDMKKIKEMYGCSKTSESSSGHIVPSKEPQDKYNNCGDYKNMCGSNTQIKTECARTCSGKY